MGDWIDKRNQTIINIQTKLIDPLEFCYSKMKQMIIKSR